MSFSKTLLDGQRRDIGRYDLPSSGGLPGLSRGIIFACFQRAGILAEQMELLKMLQRKLKPFAPRCFKCKAVISSGPAAVEFLMREIAVCTSPGVKGLKFGSSLWFL